VRNFAADVKNIVIDNLIYPLRKSYFSFLRSFSIFNFKLNRRF